MKTTSIISITFSAAAEGLHLINAHAHVISGEDLYFSVGDGYRISNFSEQLHPVLPKGATWRSDRHGEWLEFWNEDELQLLLGKEFKIELVQEFDEEDNLATEIASLIAPN